MLIACSIMKAGFQCLLGRENEELKLSTNDLMDISHITCNDMLLIFIPVMLFPFLLLNNLMDRKKKWGCIGCVPYLWVGCSFFLFSLQLSYLYHPFITVIGLLRCCICSSRFDVCVCGSCEGGVKGDEGWFCWSKEVCWP